MYSHYIAPEVMVGQLSEPNTNFPEVGIQKSFFLNFGVHQLFNKQEWAYRLNFPKTGISFGFSDYGNSKYVGKSYSAMPYIDFGLSKNERLRLLLGIGLSYHNAKYHIKRNPLNKGVTTDAAWAFRSSFLYEILKRNSSSLKLSLNYLHHSNGHVKLPNQGFNSFLLGVSYEMKYANEYNLIRQNIEREVKNRTTYNYYSFRFGVGQNVLSQVFNDKKEVYTAALTYGKVINKTYCFGIGAYYRLYEHYYDYIINEENLIAERFSSLHKSPYRNATNFGVFGSGELLLNHIGIEFQLGLNIHKPFYQVDWVLNQGYVFIAYNESDEPYIAVAYGELDSYYKIKKTISSRLGLKLYFVGIDKSPKQNFYIGAHLNANLGQADFSELSLGYVYNFNFN